MTADSHRELILILDFGGQYAHLIARRVRDLNVFCQVVRHDLTAERIAELNPKGLILSGGPASVYAPEAPQCDRRIFDLGMPVLGICYGMQLAVHLLGGDVKPAGRREFGPAACRFHETDGLFAGLKPESTVWMSHGDQVQTALGDFLALAATDTCPVAAVRHRARPVYGLQFHPEVSHTAEGTKVLHNFLFDVCGCRGNWRVATIIEDTVAGLRQAIGTDRVICGLSGGVDSSVTAALLLRAVGPQVACIFVDNGARRKKFGRRSSTISARTCISWTPGSAFSRRWPA
jgi:GMP synthase (glutamine-hydrolysing)